MCTAVLCAPHERVLVMASFADFVESVCFPFGVPSDAVAIAALAGSNVSRRQETERMQLVRELSRRHRRYNGRCGEHCRYSEMVRTPQTVDRASCCSLAAAKLPFGSVSSPLSSAACDYSSGRCDTRTGIPQRCGDSARADRSRPQGGPGLCSLRPQSLHR